MRGCINSGNATLLLFYESIQAECSRSSVFFICYAPGIEEIGVSIEEPFSILPLEAICGTIEANVRELQQVGEEAQETDWAAPDAVAAAAVGAAM
jgi:predicted membrane chloride channel (bestrophin family)